MHRFLIVGSSSLLLMACDIGEAQDRRFIQPGEWKIVNGSPGYEMTYRKCLSEEDIAKPELGVLGMDNPGCSKDRFYVAGGKIQFTLACALPKESSDGVRMTGLGQYTSTSFDISIERPRARDAAIRGERIGDCDSSKQVE